MIYNAGECQDADCDCVHFEAQRGRIMYCKCQHSCELHSIPSKLIKEVG